MEEKTIVGIASAAGGGIGIIRVSGSESMKILCLPVFRRLMMIFMKNWKNYW